VGLRRIGKLYIIIYMGRRTISVDGGVRDRVGVGWDISINAEVTIIRRIGLRKWGHGRHTTI